MSGCLSFVSVFFFNDTATTEIYTLSLHDALPISAAAGPRRSGAPGRPRAERDTLRSGVPAVAGRRDRRAQRPERAGHGRRAGAAAPVPDRPPAGDAARLRRQLPPALPAVPRLHPARAALPEDADGPAG